MKIGYRKLVLALITACVLISGCDDPGDLPSYKGYGGSWPDYEGRWISADGALVGSKYKERAWMEIEVGIDGVFEGTNPCPPADRLARLTSWRNTGFLFTDHPS